MALKGRILLRISAQIFNEIEDYRILVAALATLGYPSRATRSK